MKKADVVMTKTFQLGGGRWIIEVYDHEGDIMRCFVGSRGDDLWDQYEEWFESLD